MTYRHTQTGRLLPAAAAVIAVGLLAALAAARDLREALPVVGVLALLAGAAAVFSSLTVEIEGDRLRVWFGPGWIRRTILLRAIASAEAARVPWYVGRGMRWWGYWIFNVAGPQAVLLRLRDGRRFGVGTDQPDALLEALARAGVTVRTG